MPPLKARLAQLAPHAALVHAKTYFGGGRWYSVDLDYKRIAALLRKHGYRVVSASFESAFSRTGQDFGRSPEVVYRVVLESESGTVRTGRLLMWNVLLGRPTAENFATLRNPA